MVWRAGEVDAGSMLRALMLDLAAAQLGIMPGKWRVLGVLDCASQRAAVSLN
jgi:hypothetical protein